MQARAACAIVIATLCTAVVAASPETGTDGGPITVVAGNEARAPMRIVVPRAIRTSVAVLVDSTGSQSRDLAATTQDLALALDASETDDAGMSVAVAAAGDVSLFPFGTSTDRAYRLLRQLTPTRAEWASILASLRPVEGGGDDAEGQLPAIVEMLTSRETEPSAAAVAFEPDTRHVVVVTSDHAPHVDTDEWCAGATCVSYPGPAPNVVQRLLDLNDITLIGLAHGDSGSLQPIATATGGAIIRSESVDRVDRLAEAIDAAPVTLHPHVASCDGVEMQFDPPSLRATPGRAVEFQSLVTAGRDLAPGPRACIVRFGGGIEQSIEIDVVADCGDSPSGTTASPTWSSPSTTLDASGTTVGAPSTMVDAPGTLNATTSLDRDGTGASCGPTSTSPGSTTTVTSTSAPSSTPTSTTRPPSTTNTTTATSTSTTRPTSAGTTATSTTTSSTTRPPNTPPSTTVSLTTTSVPPSASTPTSTSVSIGTHPTSSASTTTASTTSQTTST